MHATSWLPQTFLFKKEEKVVQRQVDVVKRLMLVMLQTYFRLSVYHMSACLDSCCHGLRYHVPTDLLVELLCQKNPASI